MDVSKLNLPNEPTADLVTSSDPLGATAQAVPASPTPPSDGQLGGEELIRQLVAASGLPEAAVHQELDEICALAGQNPGELTLDQLRQAMLTYLQALDSGHIS